MTNTNEKVKIPKYRTLPECIDYIHEIDAGSAINYNALRRLVKEKTLKKTIFVGNKALVDLNEILDLIGYCE